MAEAKGSDTGTKLILWGGVGFAAYLGYKYIIRPGVVEPLKMKQDVQRMRIGKIFGIEFKDDFITFKFPVENPNNNPLIVRAIVGEVFVRTPKGTIKIGAVNHYGTDIIKPVGATNFDLAVKVNLVNEFLLISSMIRGNIKGLVVIFNGTVNANGRPWPVKEQVRIS